MKWTQEYVWSKIEELVPHARVSGMVMPSALDHAAVQLFLKDEGHHNGSYRAYVIAEAIKELHTKGWMEFGDVSEDWS